MPITDDRSTNAAPPPPPPSFVRRHPILAGFGVLSALSLFTALWPVSAIVISVAIAGHVTGVDRVAWSLAHKLAARVTRAVSRHGPGAATPGPAAPSGPRHAAHPPAAAARLRQPAPHGPASRVPVRPHRRHAAEHPVETGVDGPGV
jgi:hypothetical protein